MKVGDFISLNTISINKQEKIVPKNYKNGKEKITKKLFEIIGQTHYMSGDTKITTYLIAVPDSYTGWIISNFHYSFCDVPKRFIGKKFREINSSFY